MPDLQKLGVQQDDEFIVVVQVGVSFIKGDPTMNFKVAEQIPPRHLRLVRRRKGMGSTADLDATLDLSETKGSTELKWQADARIGGRIASVSQRLISAQAEKILNQLFECLGSKPDGPPRPFYCHMADCNASRTAHPSAIVTRLQQRAGFGV